MKFLSILMVGVVFATFTSCVTNQQSENSFSVKFEQVKLKHLKIIMGELGTTVEENAQFRDQLRQCVTHTDYVNFVKRNFSARVDEFVVEIRLLVGDMFNVARKEELLNSARINFTSLLARLINPKTDEYKTLKESLESRWGKIEARDSNLPRN
jgi:hypothetical protein